MASLDEDRVWANVLYYGDPGTGKTTSMAGLANTHGGEANGTIQR